jgi:RsiW-degrading membrane proteinase PrsW (M82 family)
MMNIFVALLIATAVPLVALYVIHTLDLYRTGEFRFLLLSFVWGIVAFVLAARINTATLDYNLVTLETFRRFSAPIIEEILKALILIYLVRRPQFTYFVDGAIYGFAIGIGFAIVENYSYALGNPGAALGVAVGRVLSTNLIHAAASAMMGIALGLARFQRPPARAFLPLAGLLLAMAVHVAFNNLVTRVSSGLLMVYAAGAGFGSAAVIAAAIKRGLAEEKIWIEETLGAADRVTAGEVAVVSRLADLQKVLAPLAERFGAEKAAQIERFLLLQARLGIFRKTLEKLADEKMAQAVEAEMAKLRLEMDEARRSVGAYCMLYLRHIFPEEASPLWERLEALIEERTAARPATGGMDLWADLNKRITQAGASAGSESQTGN